MTPRRLSRRLEFTPVPCGGSVFVYMMPPQNVMRHESHSRDFTPVIAPDRKFYKGTKFGIGIM